MFKKRVELLLEELFRYSRMQMKDTNPLLCSVFEESRENLSDSGKIFTFILLTLNET